MFGISNNKGDNIRFKIFLISVLLLFVISTSVYSVKDIFRFENDAKEIGEIAAENSAKEIRVGYFPNVNHAQAVIGFGNGVFQEQFGTEVKVDNRVFNAGPSIIEALFANQLDMAFVGPNPAINGYKISNESLKIISGASSGGTLFVVREDSNINSTGDFHDKKFSSPQIGNTQDVALRKFLLDNGYKTTDMGGDVKVLPAANPDIVTLMLKKDIDGAWVPEPWGSKLIKEGNGKLFLDEKDLWKPDKKFVTTQLIVKTDFLKKNPEIVKKILSTHVNITNWLNENKEEGMKVFNEEIKKISGEEIPEEILKDSFDRIDFTYDPIKESLFEMAKDSFEIGYLGNDMPDLEGIYDLDLLNQVLKERGLEEIK
ncbi:MAG: ABC transporter substrate-binding protein [Nitrososphaeraceae archaeon]